MTPEERFERIEHTLQRTVELQAQQGAEIDKQNDAIRSLIVVARTLLDSMQEFREDHKQFMVEMEKLCEAQAATDGKLNILVETVDRVIRHRNGKE